MKSYKDLDIYNEAYRLALAVHVMTQKLAKAEHYELGSQVRRAAQSVRPNIGEGYGRREYKNEFIRSLIFARASLLETGSHLEMSRSLYENIEIAGLIEDYNLLGKKLAAFIHYVESSWMTPHDK